MDLENITWFKNKNSDFQIGIELHKDKIVEEHEDKRQFIKVHFTYNNKQCCQTFYKSSGINSKHAGTWYPTNAISIRLDTSAENGIYKYRWFITKKPWVIDEDLDNRFGENKEVEMVSDMLSTNEEIKSFLSQKKINKMNNYEINVWIGNCNSYNWFKPFYEKKPDYIPDLNPKTSNLWIENSNGKLILPVILLNKPKMGYELDNLIKMEKNNYQNLEGIEKITKPGRLKQLRKTVNSEITLGLIHKHEYPKTLLSREELINTNEDIITSIKKIKIENNVKPPLRRSKRLQNKAKIKGGEGKTYYISDLFAKLLSI